MLKVISAISLALAAAACGTFIWQALAFLTPLKGPQGSLQADPSNVLFTSFCVAFLCTMFGALLWSYKPPNPNEEYDIMD
ncbi:MAG: hypothetical protein ACAH35_01905 [Candidatus Paceibacterota bacterium]